ncbi:MAG: MBL fold metallo-hydrolase [Synergistaceae bacterium]|nr:MBL fold metallo-hydrolase [Synergistaceae bacterium]
MEHNEKNAEILVLTVNSARNRYNTIHPVIIADGRERVLIDCGYPGQLADIESAAESSGVPLSELTAVIITHHDHDHCGSLRDIREKYPNIQVMASELDAPHIDGTKRSLRLEYGEAIGIEPEILSKIASAVKPAPVDILLRDGDVLPLCGGTEIIATPGHMPGHISVYARRHRTLITGDALIATGDRLRIANPQYAIDAALARASVEKLAKYDIDTFICYHGGVVRTRLPQSGG